MNGWQLVPCEVGSELYGRVWKASHGGGEWGWGRLVSKKRAKRVRVPLLLLLFEMSQFSVLDNEAANS